MQTLWVLTSHGTRHRADRTPIRCIHKQKEGDIDRSFSFCFAVWTWAWGCLLKIIVNKIKKNSEFVLIVMVNVLRICSYKIPSFTLLCQQFFCFRNITIRFFHIRMHNAAIQKGLKKVTTSMKTSVLTDKVFLSFLE